MSRQRMTAPRLAAGTDSVGAALPKPAKRPAGGVTPMASGCWEHNWKIGNSDLWGRARANWCGDGTWVTYATSACWGGEGWYPTLKYLGCWNYTLYGAGWNVYDVESHWDLCYLWNPVFQQCHGLDRTWLKYRHAGNGAWGWTL